MWNNLSLTFRQSEFQYRRQLQFPTIDSGNGGATGNANPPIYKTKSIKFVFVSHFSLVLLFIRKEGIGGIGVLVFRCSNNHCITITICTGCTGMYGYEWVEHWNGKCGFIETCIYIQHFVFQSFASCHFSSSAYVYIVLRLMPHPSSKTRAFALSPTISISIYLHSQRLNPIDAVWPVLDSFFFIPAYIFLLLIYLNSRFSFASSSPCRIGFCPKETFFFLLPLIWQ